jgi:L-ribulose-5-phosphate 4-epimerase
VNNAIALEAIATMASQTLALAPGTGVMPEYLLERHFQRKHGPGAYYGQSSPDAEEGAGRASEHGSGPR